MLGVRPAKHFLAGGRWKEPRDNVAPCDRCFVGGVVEQTDIHRASAAALGLTANRSVRSTNMGPLTNICEYLYEYLF